MKIIIFVCVLLLSAPCFSKTSQTDNKGIILGPYLKTQQPKGLQQKIAPFVQTMAQDGDKKNYSFSSIPYNKLNEEIKNAIDGLCSASKGLSFKAWVAGSSEAGVWIFSNKIEGGLEINISCTEHFIATK